LLPNISPTPYGSESDSEIDLDVFFGVISGLWSGFGMGVFGVPVVLLTVAFFVGVVLKI